MTDHPALHALIVAHGQPGSPDGPEQEMASLAVKVAGHLPGARIAAVTLAAPGALEAALVKLTAPLIVPFFMADGWFTRTNLPNRLRAAGGADFPILPPFGLWSATQSLIRQTVLAAAQARGWQPQATTLVLAAHGSGRSQQPAKAARAVQQDLAATTGFRDIRLGFIEEAPFIGDALAGLGPQSLCLPLFVARWGHVIEDLPNAVAAAGFTGQVMDPIGCHTSIPSLIAAQITAWRNSEKYLGNGTDAPD